MKATTWFTNFEKRKASYITKLWRMCKKLWKSNVSQEFYDKKRNGRNFMAGILDSVVVFVNMSLNNITRHQDAISNNLRT